VRVVNVDANFGRKIYFVNVHVFLSIFIGDRVVYLIFSCKCAFEQRLCIATKRFGVGGCKK